MAAKILPRCFIVAASLAVVLAAVLITCAMAYAQGLAGAPVDPRFTTSNQVTELADFGYDTARDISRVVTCLSTIPALLLGIWRFSRASKTWPVRVGCARHAPFTHPLWKRSHDGVRGLVEAIALTFSIPTMVHLIGTFAINNFGGLCGGL